MGRALEQTPVRLGGTSITKEQSLTVRNPFSHDPVGEVPSCSAGDVDHACQAAANALSRADFPQYERARVLEVAAEALRGRVEQFGHTIAEEAGKPIRSALTEARRCVETLTFAAVEARRLSGELVPMEASASGNGKLGLAMRVPLGVVGAITPFNFPLNLVAHKLAPAIAAGCPVVLKPATSTPFSAIRLVELLVESGLPDDWISVVTGSGKEVGDALVVHPVPRLITFTGSPDVGWAIPARAPQKKVALELGSNSPLIVQPDADLAAVAIRIADAGFSYAGQSCDSTQRVLVHRDVEEEFLVVLAEAVSSLTVGDPIDESTDVGPLITPEETRRVLSWIIEAANGGGQVVIGGRLEDDILLPTVVHKPPHTAKLWACEVFGPVVAVDSYSDFDEAIRLANDSEYGLQVGVFTNDLTNALSAARRLDFGAVFINEVPTYRTDQQPFGGVKKTGNTREGPAYAVEEMTQLRLVSFGAP